MGAEDARSGTDFVSSGFGEMSVRDLHDIRHLRSVVFVVEQDCVYNDVDGRDAEAGTVHHWIRVDGVLAAYARLLDDGAGVGQIGRVVTHADHRSCGHAARLISHIVDTHDGPLALDAQSHLVSWYERLGFSSAGPEFVEDGIPHTPMRRG